MPQIVIFLDLDDTILQTAPKCPAGEPVELVAVDRAGRALSFMTRAQRRLLGFWLERGTVIPVTGRTDDALARVAIKFESWRITHHGAVIRQPDGRLPVWWHDEVRPLLVAAESPLQEIAARLNEGATSGGYRVSRHSIEGCLTYLSVKSDDDGAALARLRSQLEEIGLPPELALHHNGNNFALIVKGTRKHDAVRRVVKALEESGSIITIGAGDSLTDIPFLRVCDFALVPRESQIQRDTWNAYSS